MDLFFKKKNMQNIDTGLELFGSLGGADQILFMYLRHMLIHLYYKY